MKKLLALLVAACFALAPAAVFAEDEKSVNIFEMTAGTSLDLEPYRGKAIFINFFTKWCHYCMEEMPEIRKAFDSYDPDELQMILVHVWDGETEKETAEVIEEHGLHGMTFFEDTDGSLARLFRLAGYPASFFVEKDGSVLGMWPGVLDYDVLEMIFGEMGIAKAETAESGNE